MQQKTEDALIRKLVDMVDGGLLVYKNDSYSTILYANESFYTMVGYTRQQVKTLFQNRFAAMMMEDIPAILRKVARAVESTGRMDFEYRMQRGDGSILWIHDTAVYDQEDDVFYVLLMDVTEKKSMEYQMGKLQAVLQHIPNKIAISGADGRIEYTNLEFDRCPYIDHRDIGQKTLEEVAAGQVVGRSFDQLWNGVQQGQVVSYETWGRQGDSIQGHDKNYLVPICSGEGEIVNVVLLSEDLAKLNDSLTQLPSRSIFENYFNAQRELLGDAFQATLVVLDIDGFKVVNDRYGHTVGDRAIQVTGQRLMALLENDSYVARYGGDEFIFFLPTVEPTRVQSCIQRLMESAWKPISTPEGSFCVTYSLGAASARGNIPFSQLFERADTALYQAKRKGKNGFVYSTEKEAVNTPPRESQPVPVEGNAAFVQLLQQSQGPALWKIVWEQADGTERMEKMLQAIEEGAEEPADWQLYQQTVEKSWQAFARQELPGYLCIPLPAAFLADPLAVDSLLEHMRRARMVPERIVWQITVDWRGIEYEKLVMPMVYMRQAGCKFWVSGVGRSWRGLHLLLDSSADFIGIDHGFYAACNGSRKHWAARDLLLQLAQISGARLILEGGTPGDDALFHYIIP